MYSKLNLFEIGELEWEDNPDINYYRTGELDYLQVNINNTTLPLVEQLRYLLFDSVIICLRDLEGIVENGGIPNIVPRRVVNLDEEETEADIQIKVDLELFRSTPNLGILMGIISKLNRNSVVTDDIFEHMEFFEVIFEIPGKPGQPHYSNFNTKLNLSPYLRDILWKLLYAVFYYNHIVNEVDNSSKSRYIKSRITVPLNNKELQMSLLTYLFKPISVNKSLRNLLDDSKWMAYIDREGLTSALKDYEESHLINTSSNYDPKQIGGIDLYRTNINYMTSMFIDTLPE